MGRSKEDWMTREALQDMHEWIDENYGEGAIEEGSKEWSEAARAYEEYCDNMQQQHEDDLSREEYEYYLFMNSKEADATFYRDILELKVMLNSISNMTYNQTFLKMVFAHAVTILEVYLEDATKSLILSSNTYLSNTIKNVKPFSDSTFKLSEIALEADGIKKFVINKMSDNLFHNIPKALNTLSGILDRKINVASADVCLITSIRHDVVHRNGKNKDGAQIEITFSFVDNALEKIEKFVSALDQEIADPL
ncbi:hypothetical protein IB232_07555 [Pseudomonas sp. PDM15]|uniref:HEPN domain-containing protein n=1 Tax=Pseudomonas sp. PDM15 TaxID=2769303 RepID=UPI00177DB4DA|nr:HEPN domain-containing protein [Pseudomonas sp. PDM15]MBD9425171.1 hypothetical protein [Pseudomonas sp. PDM15]